MKKILSWLWYVLIIARTNAMAAENIEQTNESPCLYTRNAARHSNTRTNDYAIYFEHDKNGNPSVRITATYYIQKGDKNAKDAAEYATTFWNEQSGQFIVRIGDKNDPAWFRVNFDLKVIEVDDPHNEMLKDKKGERGARTKDGSSNILKVVHDNDLMAIGRTTGENTIRIRASRIYDVQPGPHEIGHTLCMKHEGENSSSVMAPGNTDATAVFSNSIQQVIIFGLNNRVINRFSVHTNLPSPAGFHFTPLFVFTHRRADRHHWKNK